MRKIILLILAFLYWLPCLSCSCIGQSTVKNEIKNSDVVLVGKVVKSEIFSFTIDLTSINLYMVKYYVEIENLYKGKLKKKVIEIITGTGKGDCGFIFDIGQDYIIYSKYRNRYYEQGKAVNPYLYTNSCSRTSKKEMNEIAEIKKYRRPIRL